MKTLFTLLLMLCLGAACATAQAQGCTASASTLSFGTYNPQSSTPVENTGNITVTCQATISLLITYTVKLSAGNSGAYAQRKMLAGTSAMNYQAYLDATRSTIWGDGSSSTNYILDGYLLQVLTPVVKTYTVYGKIPGSQNIAAGSYTDTLTILVSY
ncbi:spore coat U domain-containing protein [Herbaspirillum sp. WKF16]|jgi:spore coat protein U-like protein|uniref:Csu type fimbrial protein n=1 Tax=Herbaspirillum sp. WKF16 TaxID=3028312 RepID=UPI0023A99F30|nr:spore coat U domain-containing protein [Herbaspirillum sp. WKF16]WDZ94330.1 spore coat U domain-containing protein [Herbaspirillum sp. WKF16]